MGGCASHLDAKRLPGEGSVAVEESPMPRPNGGDGCRRNHAVSDGKFVAQPGSVVQTSCTFGGGTSLSVSTAEENVMRHSLALAADQQSSLNLPNCHLEMLTIALESADARGMTNAPVISPPLVQLCCRVFRRWVWKRTARFLNSHHGEWPRRYYRTGVAMVPVQYWAQA